MNVFSRVSAFLGWRGAQPELLRFTLPAQLSDHLAYIILYAPHFPPEDQLTNARAFGVAFTALGLFTANSASHEAREALEHCSRNLQVAFALYEAGDVHGGTRLVQEADTIFQGARKYLELPEASLGCGTPTGA